MPKDEGRTRVIYSPRDDRHNGRARAVAEERIAKLRDRRRTIVNAPPGGEYGRLAAPDATGTLVPHKVFDPTPGQVVLKDGANNAKLGGDVVSDGSPGQRLSASPSRSGRPARAPASIGAGATEIR